MSAIFLSHSSGDDQHATALKEWLAARGHRSVFLDFDPEDGIPAGRSWEQELYEQLRACRGIVVLCSEQSMDSRWCFAEITHARSLGKHIFPIKIADCEVDPVLLDRQVIDLTEDREDGLIRLERGLARAGISASDPFDWDSSRPPYPGLLAFDEDDAAIFFGRERNIGDGLDVLNRVERFGGAGLTLVLGASGSGKSSLVRAGMLPRLRRDTERWLVVDPFRPGEVPILNLTQALGAAFAAHGSVREESELLLELLEDFQEPEVGTRGALAKLAGALKATAERPEATVLLVVDQFEELLVHPSGHECRRFLEMLRNALSDARRPFCVLATMRSDFLPLLQQTPEFQGLDFESLSVAPMSPENLAATIQKPAELVGVEVEPELVQAMLGDLATEDALPLLAFSLRELYEGFARQGKLTLHDYKEHLGGIQGAVARAARSVLADADLTPQSERDLRSAFLAMVRLGESGRYARRQARLDEIPDGARPMIERFVQARLLIAHGKTVEVAHEALFRHWRRLRNWLRESHEALRLHSELTESAEQWESSDKDADYLLRRGRLQRALELRDEGLLPLEERDLRFLEASHNDRKRFDLRRRLRRRAIVVGALLIAAVMAVLTVQAQLAERDARFRQLVMTSDKVRDDDPMLASMLAREAVRSKPTVADGSRALLDSLALTRRTTLLAGHEGPINFGYWHPTKELVLTSSLDGKARIWTTEGDTIATLEEHEGAINHAVWSPDGGRLLTVSDDRTARIWDIQGKRLVILEGHQEEILRGAWSPDGSLLVTTGFELVARLWDTAGFPITTLDGHEDSLNYAAWSPDGSRFLTSSEDRTSRIWSAEGDELAILEGHEGGINLGTWSHDGLSVLTVSSDGTARLWSSEGKHLQTLEGHEGDVRSGEWSPDDRQIVTCSTDQTARIWDLEDNPTSVLSGHQGAVVHCSWSPRGDRVLTVSNDTTVRVWNLEGRQLETLEGHSQAVVHGDWSRDGTRLLTVSNDQEARIWELGGNPVRLFADHRGWVTHGDWSPDGEGVLTVADTQARVFDLETRATTIFDHGDEVTHATWSRPAGDRILTVGLDGLGQLWGLNGEKLLTLDGHENAITHSAWSFDGKHILTVSDDYNARVWNLEGESRALEGHKGLVHFGAWSADSQLIVTASADNTARVWTVTGELIAALEGHQQPVRSAVWNPRSSLIVATASEDHTARIWNSDGTVRAILRGHRAPISTAAWSPTDGDVLLTVSDDHTGRLWSLKGDSLATLKGHQGPVRHGAWSPDGESILTVSDDLTARIWSSEGDPVAVLRGHTLGINFGAWSPPYGERILTVSNDETARLWPPVALDKLADELITRDFTAEERTEYLN